MWKKNLSIVSPPEIFTELKSEQALKVLDSRI